MLTQLQRWIVEMIARDQGVDATADRICRQAEDATRGVLCSMVTVDRAGHLHPLAGPSLPDHYSVALDGIPIGPDVGSCGTAAFLREPVTVTDIFTDPRWTPYGAITDIAGPLGMRACWSSPIKAEGGRVLGAFGFYFREHRGPSADEERLVAEYLDLSAILLDRRETRAENHRLASFDALSGIGNRTSFERALAATLSADGPAGLLLVNIDHLKCVNDSFGHATGDLLIREIAQRLTRQVRPGQAFRLAGGEFAVLVDDPTPDAGIGRAAARILAAAREAALCGGHLIAPAITCGGAIVRSFQPRDPALLWRQADLALRQAKATTRGGFILFEEHLALASTRRSQVLQTAARALAEHRVEAHYQPIVRLDTRRVIGLEALCRVRTIHGDLVPADQLAAAMRAPSTANLVTDRMLAFVARDIRRWLNEGIVFEHVGVNISMEDFGRGDLHRQIMTAFSHHHVPLDHLVLEVTETVPLDDGSERIVTAIEQLRAAGLRVALDDFGTGYASLTHLLSFPVDIIKTDKSLMQRFAPGEAGETIIRGLLDIADGLGIRVVAEGVENVGQASLLEGIGCEYAQGYLFGAPETADAISRRMLGSAGAGPG